MTVAEMLALFQRHRVPEWFYVTDGRLGTGECVGIERDGARWRLYYSERGGKSPLGDFDSEDGAVRAMVSHVDSMLRQSGLSALPTTSG